MPTKKKRSKFYSFIAYKENGDIDKIRFYLKNMHYSAVISPLHTPDRNPVPSTENSSELKPHYHVVLKFPNPRVCDCVRDEFNAVANIANPQCVGDVRVLTRYLTHMDDPDKEQFDVGPEIFGNYPYDKYIYQFPSACDDANHMLEIVQFLDTLDKPTFSNLLLSSCENPELTTFILRHSYAVNVVVNDFCRQHK